MAHVRVNTMPLYKYTCIKCDHEFKSIEESDEVLIKCPECGWWAIRNEVPGSFSTRYKGDGFYSTDYGETEEE